MSGSVFRALLSALASIGFLAVAATAALKPLTAVADPPPPPVEASALAGASAADRGLSPDGLRASWWRDHLAFRLQGIELRHDLVVGSQSLELRLRGPIVKGAPGLRLELRGWAFRGMEGSFQAFGTGTRQGFRFKIEF